MGIESHKFQKGKSGNPNGRPKGQLTDLKKIITEILMDTTTNGIPAVKLIFMRMRQDAIKGDPQAQKLLLAYAYGQPKASIDHTSGGEPLNISTAGLTDEEACAVVMNGGNG